MITSRMPYRRTRWSMCSSTGRLATGTMGLETNPVKGRNRVPSPAAIIIARTESLLNTQPRSQRMGYALLGNDSGDVGCRCHVKRRVAHLHVVGSHSDSGDVGHFRRVPLLYGNLLA